MNYTEKLKGAVAEARSCLCVGLDPHLDLIPEPLNLKIEDTPERVTSFLKRIIEITHPFCAAYKPNLAFFEALGVGGLTVLRDVLDAIPAGKIVIADAKRSDISSTAERYKKAFFDHFSVDAITLNPLMGFETVDVYSGYPDKALYVLTLTSNPGAADFFLKPFDGHDTMSQFIATSLKEHQVKEDTSLGMVVGATHPAAIEPVLNRHPEGHLLLPGVGSQGGSIAELQAVLRNHRGIPLISSSRSILFAGGDNEEWEQAVIEKVTSYREELMPITGTYV